MATDVWGFEEDEELDESNLWDSDAAKKAEKQIKKENRKSKISNFFSGLFGSSEEKAAAKAEETKKQEAADKKERNSFLIFGIVAGVLVVGVVILAIVKRK